jgi:hypothetical protein
MGDLRGELERITAQFVSSVLAAACDAPIGELTEEVAGTGRRFALRASAPLHAPRGEAAPAVRGPTFPRGVRGAPTAMKRAIEWQRQLDAGQVRSRAAIARREGLTRARVTQIMNLLRGRRKK